MAEKKTTFRLILKDSENRAVSVDITSPLKLLVPANEKKGTDLQSFLIKKYGELLEKEKESKEQSEKNDKEVATKQKKIQEKNQDRLDMEPEEFLNKYPEEKPKEEVVEPSKPKKRIKRK